jgi:hypothetical protein
MCCVAPRRWCGGAATSEQKSSSDLLFRRRNMVRLCSFDSRSDQQRRCMYRKPPPCWRPTESYHRSEMIAPKCFCRRLFILPFTSKIRLEAENAILRYQLARDTGGMFVLPRGRLFFIWLYRWFPPTWMPFGSSDPIPWCGGTVTVFDIAGIGSPHRQVIGHESMRICIP